MSTHTLFTEAGLDIELLRQLQQPPEPFAQGTPRFWDEDHISQQLLAAHLDPAVEAASRAPATIDRTVGWIVRQLGLAPGAEVIDLGCGPGLYAERLAAQGMRVTGVDFSRRSIAHATRAAREQSLEITYRCQDYLTLEDERSYDAALLIYGDFCVLAPEQRARLLQHVRRALRPGGRFVLDVSTPEHRRRSRLGARWYAAERGFWRRGPHLVLEQGFSYPDQQIALDQYAVVDADGRLEVYRNWFQDYTPERITAELAAGGFDALGLWGDLAGAPLSAEGEWIGVVARPREAA